MSPFGGYLRAGGFLRSGQHRAQHRLIGPTVFPIYLLALKVALGITLIITLGLALLDPAVADAPRSSLVEVLTALIRRGLVVFAWTTLVFAAFDVFQSRLLARTTWDPRRLPPVVRLENRLSRLDSLYELLLLAACLLWLLLAPSFPFLVLGGAARIVELAPIWRTVYVPIVLLIAAHVGLGAINFIRPFWSPARSIARIAIDVGMILVLLVLLRADEWVVAKAGATLPSGEPVVPVDILNFACEIGLIVTGIVSAAGIVREIFGIGSRRRAASRGTATFGRADVVSASDGPGPTVPDGGDDLLERYLQAVRLFLPRRRQDEVAAELSASLAARLEDLESQVGRTLTDDERADIVRRYGHPMEVAGRYRSHEGLIGSTLFPFYVYALGGGLGATLLVTVALAVVGPGLADWYSRLVGQLVAFPGRGLMVFAWTTLVCAGVDRWQTRRRAEAHASQEREEAQAIQRALLPAILPAIAGCELAVRWQPASAFGGDCYDAIRLGDTAVAISIADVCGKGLPAALVMSSLQASVRAFASSDPTPRSLVSHLNQALCRNRELRRFVTLFYGVYDSDTRRLAYCNAGHNPPAVVRADGSVVRLTSGGMVVGVFDHAIYEQGEVRLEPGDHLILFTDGITEAESSEGMEFGDGRLLETVVRYRTSTPEGLLRALFEEVTRFSSRHLRDDATAIAVAIR